MPVRSLHSSVMRWPSGETVDLAVRTWAEHLAQAELAVQAVGYFGSYARHEAAVGSDVDVLVITDRLIPIRQRLGGAWAIEHFPVPADVLVYDPPQWQALADADLRFYRMLRDKTVWGVGHRHKVARPTEN